MEDVPFMVYLKRFCKLLINILNYVPSILGLHMFIFFLQALEGYTQCEASWSPVMPSMPLKNQELADG